MQEALDYVPIYLWPHVTEMFFFIHQCMLQHHAKQNGPFTICFINFFIFSYIKVLRSSAGICVDTLFIQHYLYEIRLNQR